MRLIHDVKPSLEEFLEDILQKLLYFVIKTRSQLMNRPQIREYSPENVALYLYRQS